jgi:hypothetical protein
MTAFRFTQRSPVFQIGAGYPNRLLLMNLHRRDFIKTAVTASVAAAGLGASTAAAAAVSSSGAAGGREYYELRAYRLKAGASPARLDAYLEKAFIPALNARGIKSVGVFTEPEPKDGPAVWVLIPHASMESVASVTADINRDATVLSAGADYLNLSDPKNPAFDRMDSWLLLAFAGLPKLEIPALAQAGKSRIYEMRTYESFSELKALKKVEMFNSGEIEVMKELNMSPVFYGQGLVGRDLPHLTYMLSGPDRETHAKHWTAFGKHPVWNKLKSDPQYADTVSKITSRILVPATYSQV